MCCKFKTSVAREILQKTELKVNTQRLKNRVGMRHFTDDHNAFIFGSFH